MCISLFGTAESKIPKKRLMARFDKNAKDAKLREFVLRTSMAMPIESIIGMNAVQAPIEPGYERIILIKLFDALNDLFQATK